MKNSLVFIFLSWPLAKKNERLYGIKLYPSNGDVALKFLSLLIIWAPLTPPSYTTLVRCNDLNLCPTIPKSTALNIASGLLNLFAVNALPNAIKYCLSFSNALATGPLVKNLPVM